MTPQNPPRDRTATLIRVATEKRRRQKERRAEKQVQLARQRRTRQLWGLVRTWLVVTGLILAVGTLATFLSR
jgi:hypothetical protein